MTDVKRLLKEATPLPWRYFADEGEGDELQDGRGEMIAIGFRDSIVIEKKPIARDAALIVHAVNHLPAYEAAVEALAYYVNERDAYHDCANDAPNWRHRCRVAKARKALRRLREEAS